LQASPQVLHSATLGHFSHSFWQSLQTIATALAKWPVCSELTAASTASAPQAAQAVIARRDAFCGGFFESLVFRRMHRLFHLSAHHSLEATAAAIPAAAMNSRRSIVFLLTGFD
jgi:hypothetical protein